MALDAIAQYKADTAAGGEPAYPAWADQVLQVLESLQDVTDVLDAFGDLPDRQICPDAWIAQAAESKVVAARAALASARGEA
ncbi:hypothetical protein [Pandoraea sputorum]|uniref:hypothetical protein n=1 Tax=Pandoraea sputorum TaxID=93222 RepID=UPI002F41D921